MISQENHMQRKAKIVMTTMFRNEAGVIRRMLESCAPYIDYWVIQDNGSTDGTDQIVRDFFQEKNIPGHLYQVEEGWQGFGWNRDHVTQTCQSIDHGCDWILKMDCDEVLEVDPEFDWTLLEDISCQAWNIPAVSGSTIYYRCWLWNARLPWRFNHDPCHETIYCALPEIGANYQARDLPATIRQVGYNQGQSWSVPSKFATDALVLEEKMIRENTMLTDLYHFFYIGKSYNDGCRGNYFPLGRPQQVEFAGRAVFYLDQYVNQIVKTHPPGINEMVYVSLLMMAECFDFMDDLPAAEQCYRRAEPFAPGRNDHLFGLAGILEKQSRFDEMLAVTQRMMEPDRVCPFPAYGLFIDRSVYHDTGTRAGDIHHRALQRAQGRVNDMLRAAAQPQSYPNTNLRPAWDPGRDTGMFAVNVARNPRLFVVDNFYRDPDQVRAYALSLDFQPDLRWYKGLRTTTRWAPENLRRAFEHIIGESIQDWAGGYNGVFQITTAQDPQVYHNDTQRWAAMIYLTPQAPISAGTRLHRSRVTGVSHLSEGQEAIDQTFQGDFYDGTRFDTVADAGNVYNRLVIMDARHIHSAGTYFGNTPENGRLVHLFFFD